MTLKFPEFIRAYADGSIWKDAAWRAYDIEGMATERKAKDALKVLRYRDIGYFGFSQCAADYDIINATYAKHLLGLWWTWARIALGETKRAKLRETDNAD